MDDEERNNEVVGSVEEDEVMLPGFRFHPTDEELVGFYLKRKIQHHPLSIELIRQLDIYKYDPWDLPNLARTGEKEWYFYCRRDRKYRNSTRPNRVTTAGFWKATGTDRPIYSTNAPKSKTIIIGLKKSLVFYTGRAGKALKTDWMMHEFRLPDSTNIPPNDSWAICRIFKRTNVSVATSSSLQKRCEILEDKKGSKLVLSSKTTTAVDVPLSTNLHCNFPDYSYDPFDYLEGKLPQLSVPNETFVAPPPMEVSDIAKSAMDVSSILYNMSSSLHDDFGLPMSANTSDPFISSFNSHGPHGHGLGHQDTFSLPTTLLHQMQGYNQANALLLEYSHPLDSPSSSIWDKFLN